MKACTSFVVASDDDDINVAVISQSVSHGYFFGWSYKSRRSESEVLMDRVCGVEEVCLSA